MSIESIIKLLEILAIIISASALWYLQVRGRHWQDKITRFLIRCPLKDVDRTFILNIIEDIYVSLSLIGQAIIILFGLFTLTVKETGLQSVSYLCIGPIALIVMFLIFLGVTIKLLSLKNTLITTPLPYYKYRNYTYKQFIEYSLYVGYGVLLLMTIRILIIS